MLDEKGAYTEAINDFGIPVDNQVTTTCQPTDNQRYTENRLDKNRLDKNSNNTRAFEKPTLDEVKAYCLERKNNVDAETFIDFYESKGWMIGKNKMKDWKAAVRTWEQNRKVQPVKQKGNKFSNFDQRKYDFDALENEAQTNHGND